MDVFNCLCDISFFDSESSDPRSDASFGKKDSWCQFSERPRNSMKQPDSDLFIAFHFGILERPGFGLSSSNQGLHLKLQIHDDPHFLINISMDSKPQRSMGCWVMAVKLGEEDGAKWMRASSLVKSGANGPAKGGPFLVLDITEPLNYPSGLGAGDFNHISKLCYIILTYIYM